jgi:UPF0716 family protein affecting phage T7 exclusion
MESLLLPAWDLIIFLVELAIILLLIDAIMNIIGGMFGFSWKKSLMWAAAIFGVLWLRDYFKKRNENAQEETVTDVTDADFETVEE